MPVMENSEVNFFGKKIGGGQPFFLISGPCVIESMELLESSAKVVADIGRELDIVVFFKSSYDKANRSSADSFRGPGIEKGLAMLREISKKYNIPVLTDVHSPEEAEIAGDSVDMIQIPAFLSRQTDLILAAARTGKWVNVKKGQFMAPGDAMQIVDKFRSVGSDKITICERGYTFGYNNLVVDMRSLEMMRREGIHVVMDVTHATQLPGGGKTSGGEREMAFPIARAAAAVGVDGFFMEAHPNPPSARSDATNQMELRLLPATVRELYAIDRLVKNG